MTAKRADDLAVQVRPGLLRRTLDFAYLAAGWTAGFFLVVILLLMLGLATGRMINVNIPSGDDFAAWSMVAMGFLGLAHTFKSGEMIRVGLLVERLAGPARRAVELACLAVGLATLGYFTWFAGHLTYDSWRFTDISNGVVAVPLWIPQLGFFLGLLLLWIAFLDEFVTVLKGRPPSYEREPPKTPDELVERVASGGGV